MKVFIVYDENFFFVLFKILHKTGCTTAQEPQKKKKSKQLHVFSVLFREKAVNIESLVTGALLLFHPVVCFKN